MADLPAHMAALPRHNGIPVPWFVQWFEDGAESEWGIGEPDFRYVDRRKRYRPDLARCWICGQPFANGEAVAFVVDADVTPTSRLTSEPPSHRECAEYAVQVCPFMVDPAFVPDRRTFRGGAILPSPVHPSAFMVWLTREFSVKMADGKAHYLIGDRLP